MRSFRPPSGDGRICEIGLPVPEISRQVLRWRLIRGHRSDAEGELQVPDDGKVVCETVPTQDKGRNELRRKYGGMEGARSVVELSILVCDLATSPEERRARFADHGGSSSTRPRLKMLLHSSGRGLFTKLGALDDTACERSDVQSVNLVDLHRGVNWIGFAHGP